MCGRVIRTTPRELLAQLFGLTMLPDVLPLRYNLAPTDPIPVIREPGRLELLRWGLTLDNPRASGFNARVESMGWKGYRDNLRSRRCLVIADGFYEWRAHGGKKWPYLIFREDRAPMTFAGFYDAADGCTIITKPSEGVVAALHERMPVVLEPGAFDAWLDPKIVDAMPMLRAANANGLTCYPVSRAVNAVANDDARLVDRVEEFVEGEGEAAPVKVKGKAGKKQLGLF